LTIIVSSEINMVTRPRVCISVPFLQRLIIAHRGHKVGAPEQTLAAFEMAADLGAQMIEADLRFTRDRVPIMLHDRLLDRTTSGNGPVDAVDWVTIARLDAGSWFDPKFGDQRVPRLEELFDLAASRGVALCIEAKGEAGAENATAALFAAEEIARRGRLDIDVVASFDHAALRAAVDAVPGLRTAPDRLPERGLSSAADLIAQAEAAGAKIIQHHFADLDSGVVAQVQSAGIDVWAWPPANFEEARFAFASGARGLMGDDVAAIVAVMEAEHN
jgi:glycerophosphoryl diester phosphodiesterase